MTQLKRKQESNLDERPYFTLTPPQQKFNEQRTKGTLKGLFDLLNAKIAKEESSNRAPKEKNE